MNITSQDPIVKAVILSAAKDLPFASAPLAIIPEGNLRFARSAPKMPTEVASTSLTSEPVPTVISPRAKHLRTASAFLAVIPAGNLPFARSATHAH